MESKVDRNQSKYGQDRPTSPCPSIPQFSADAQKVAYGNWTCNRAGKNIHAFGMARRGFRCNVEAECPQAQLRLVSAGDHTRCRKARSGNGQQPKHGFSALPRIGYKTRRSRVVRASTQENYFQKEKGIGIKNWPPGLPLMASRLRLECGLFG